MLTQLFRARTSMAAAWLTLALGAAAPLAAQSAAMGPIAIVPIDAASTAKVTGALEVGQGKAVIGASGSVTSGESSTQVTLPRRGQLRLCASTTLKLAADPGVPAQDTPGLMMALDRGALEMNFGAARNSDVLMTPDFRILISGPGAVELKVRLGERGDLCVDNPGLKAPYVLVTSVFEQGAYRVQPGQRVMFQHGSLREVVDHEKEPCGCPPEADKSKNEFPAAQSAGLAPMEPTPPAVAQAAAVAPLAPPLVHIAPPAPEPDSAAAASAPDEKKPDEIKSDEKKRPNAFVRFFRRLFGAK